MKRFQLALAALWLSGIAGLAASSLGNIPISQMSIATNLLPTAWIPIIQPLPGRTTNDNFRVSPATFRQYMLTNPETLWTNVSGIYLPSQFQSYLHATNIGSHQTLVAFGALKTTAAATVQLVAGTNNVDLTQKGYALLQGPTTNAADTVVRLSFGNGSGMYMDLINATNTSFTVRNGDEIYDAPTEHLFLNGDWAPSRQGEALRLFQTPFGWVEEARNSVAGTNVVTGGTLWGTDGTYLFPMTNSWFTMLPPPGLIVDTNSLTFYGTPGLNDGIALLSFGPDTGGATKRMNVGIFDAATTNENSFNYTAGPNISTLELKASLGGTDYRGVGLSAGTPAYWFFTDTVGGLSTNLFLYDPANLQGVATWRLGGYTNNALPLFQLHNGDVDATDNITLAVGPDGFVNVKGPTFSELQLNGQTAGDLIDLYSDDAQQYWHIQSQLNGGMLEAVLEPTLAEGGGASPLLGPYWFGTVATYTNEPIFSLANGTNAIVTGQPFLTFGPQSQVNFSTTNVLYRSGSDLVYTNQNASGTFLQVSSDGTHFARYGANGAVASIYGPTAGSVDIFANASASGGLIVASDSLQPGTETISIGKSSSNGAFTNAFIKGETHIVGQNDGVGNYAWVRCFVTNGIAVFDFANGGSGVAPTSISFRTNGVEVGHFP